MRLESPKEKNKNTKKLGPSNCLTNSKLVMQQKCLLMLRRATKTQSKHHEPREEAGKGWILSFSDELGPPCGVKARVRHFGKYTHLLFCQELHGKIKTTLISVQ